MDRRSSIVLAWQGFTPQNMTDRLEAIGVPTEIHSAPGAGTRLIGMIPIPGEARR